MKNEENKVNQTEIADKDLELVTGGASVSIPPSATAAVPMAISEATTPTEIKAKVPEAAKKIE